MSPRKHKSNIGKFYSSAFTFLLSWLIQGQLSVILCQTNPESDRQTQTQDSCPEDIETLTSQMLENLPDYANRVIQRTQDAHRSEGFDSYVIFAGKSEFEPLNLPQFQYNPVSNNNFEQIFFTTSERQYVDNTRQIETQNYHWLFLTPTPDGWYMVTMFSRFSSSAEEHPPTPPIESSKGIIGQAVSLWLRDCRAKKA